MKLNNGWAISKARFSKDEEERKKARILATKQKGTWDRFFEDLNCNVWNDELESLITDAMVDFLHSNLLCAIDTFVSKINYLPKSTDVSLTFFEEIIVHMIHKQCKNLMRKSQHGYIIDRSTVTKLSVFGNYVSIAPDRRK